MDGAILPLTFYCRDAQLCLAKATEAQKSGFADEELQHLKTFASLVSEAIPSHPNFRNRQEDKQVLELHVYLPEVAKRIKKLENSGCLESTCPRPYSKTHGRPSSRHPKPPLASSVASRSPAKTARLAEDRDGSLEQESSVNVGTVGTNQNEEERSWNETSDENSRGTFRTGFGDESSASEGTQHSHQYRRKKQQEDIQRHGSRGNGLREWKGDFVRKFERIHDTSDEGETRASQSKRRHNIQGRVDNRSASAPRRMQGVVVECKLKEGENLDEVDANNSESKEKPVVLAPRLSRGMKEDCEHFRRDMRILTEKANGSRISLREAEHEGMAEKLQRRLVDEMDLAAGDSNGRKHDRNRVSRSITYREKVSALRGTLIDSPRLNRLRGGQEVEAGSTQPSQKSPSATASASSSGSSLASLPLSHYIQKLKKFSPDSQLGSANLELLTPVNKAAGNGSSQHDHLEKFTAEETAASNERGRGLGLLSTTLAGGSASAIFLPASINSPGSPHGLPRPSPRLVENRFGPSASSALYTSLAHPTQLLGSSRLRPSPPETSPIAMFNSNSELHLTGHQDAEKTPSLVTILSDQLSYPHFQNDTEVICSLIGASYDITKITTNAACIVLSQSLL